MSFAMWLYFTWGFGFGGRSPRVRGRADRVSLWLTMFSTVGDDPTPLVIE
jgi:hypothetical protein